MLRVVQGGGASELSASPFTIPHWYYTNEELPALKARCLRHFDNHPAITEFYDWLVNPALFSFQFVDVPPAALADADAEDVFTTDAGALVVDADPSALGDDEPELWPPGARLSS
eukprot:COSAG01_NODE_41212_length_454_cov_1.033803_1_plen_114_part_00